MSTDRWQLLSEWHNAWLVAGADERDSLRRQFVEGHPDLAAQANALASASAGLPGFLETPALALAARDLAQDDPLLDVDTLVGPYRIVGLMARGGMGDVYRATDVRLQRDVALKLLAHAGTDDTQRIERFLQEARVTAALDHANIVKVFDVGVLDGRPYLVAELLDGETLRVRLGRGPLAAEEATRIAGDVAAGLVVAHAAGLVHRDLKPDNVFLTRSGVTKILDFGIAKLTDGPAVADGLATLTGVLLGTAGYLAPEQIRGDAVDGRTDLFALGSMLFEMSTGQRAFAREHTIDTLHAILHDDPPDLLQAAGVSPDLTAIVMRLLEKAPAARFQSAADLERALAHIARTPAAPSVPKTSARSLVTARLPRLGWIVAAALALTLGGTMLLNRRGVAPAAPELVEFPILPPEGSSHTNLAGRFQRVSRRPTRRVHREFESRVVALRAIVGLGRCTADSWHGWRAQSILEPGQPVDRFLCGQSVENGEGERGRSGRAVDMVRVHARGLGESRDGPSRDLEQPGHRRLRAVQRRQPVSNRCEARRNGDAGHDAGDDACDVPPSAALVPSGRSTFPVRRRSWDEKRAAGGIADDGGHGGGWNVRITRRPTPRDTCSSRVAGT